MTSMPRRLLSTAAPFLFTGALLLGLLAQRFLLDSAGHSDWAAWLFGGAALLSVMASAARDRQDAIPEPSAGHPPASRKQQVIGVVVSIAGLALAGWAGRRIFTDWMEIRQTWWAYLTGFGLTLLGCAIWDRYQPRAAIRRWAVWLRTQRLEALLVVAVIAVGFAVTLIGLDDYPPAGGISWNDEAQMGMAAYGILHHQSLPWQFPTSNYPVALAFAWLSNSTFALRLPFALMGALLLLPFYTLARRMTGPLPALAATFLFAVSRYRIAFVRLVLPLTPDMLLAVVAYALLLRAVHTRGKAPYYLAGLALSLGMPSHASFKTAPAFALILLCTAAVRGLRLTANRPRGERRRCVQGQIAAHLPGLLIFLIAFAIFVAPYAGISVRETRLAVSERFISVMPVLFEPGSDGSSLASRLESSWRSLSPRVREVALFFNQAGESWPAANLPGEPALDPVTGVLLVLGLTTSLVFFWRGWNAFAVLWMMVPLIGGGILTRDYRSHRFAIAMPAVYLLVGLFISQAWQRFRRLRRRWVVPFLAVLCLLLLLAGWINLGTFFGRQVHDARVRMEFDREISSVATALAEYGGTRYVYLFANYPFYNPGHDFAWMAGEPPGHRAMDLASVLPSRDVSHLDLAYVFSWPYDRLGLAAAIRSVYPHAAVNEYESPTGKFFYLIVTVEREDILSLRGLLARYWTDPTRSVSPVIVRTEPAIDTVWEQSNLEIETPFAVEWAGMLYVPTSGPYRLWIDDGAGFHVTLDDQELTRHAVMLAEGWHRLNVTGVVEDLLASAHLFWETPFGAREVVPSQMLSMATGYEGILATFYPPASDDPVWRRVEPLIALQGVPTEWGRAPIPALAGQSYRVVFEGGIRVAQPGVYEFRTDAQAGSALLEIDGNEIISDLGVNWSSSAADGVVFLDAGEHALRLTYQFGLGEFSGVHLYWTPPEGTRELVPPAVFAGLGGQPIAAVEWPVSAPAETGATSSEREQQAALGPPLRYVGAFGGVGSGAGQLREPWAIAGLADGRLLVVDKGNRRLVLFRTDGSLDSIWDDGRLVEPFDATVADDGVVYVLDSSRSRIDVYDPSGRRQRTLGEGVGLYSPRGIAVAADHKLYVADTGANRVLVMSPDGDVLRQIGRQGTELVQFDQPGSVLVDGSGNILVLDTVHNRRVVRLDAGWKVADEWKLNWASDFITPGAAYESISDSFYFTDPDLGHIYQYAGSGEMLAKWTAESFGPMRPERPTDVYVDGKLGLMYVVDTNRQMVLIYDISL